MSWTSPMLLAQGAVLSLAALCVSLPTTVLRRRSLAGALLLALALASLSVAGGAGSSTGGLSRSYLAINAGLGLLGVGLPLGLAVSVLGDAAWQGWRRSCGMLAGLMALVVGMKLLLPLANAGGWGRSLLVAAALAAVGAIAAVVLPRTGVGGMVRRVDRLIGVRPEGGAVAGPGDRVGRGLLAAHAISAFLALWVTWLPLLLLLIVMTCVTGLALERRLDGGRGLGPITILALAVLAGVAYLLIHVAGDMPLTLEALTEAPYSDAFELLVSLPALLVAWVMLRLWPFHAGARGPLTGLVGAALVTRVVFPVLPLGGAHWQPALYPLAVAAGWHAVAARRDAAALTALGALGLLAGSAVGGWCGTGVVLAGALVARPGLLGRGADAAGEAGARLLPLLVAPAVLPILRAALEVQVFYTTLTLAGLIAVLWTKPVSLTRPADTTIF